MKLKKTKKYTTKPIYLYKIYIYIYIYKLLTRISNVTFNPQLVLFDRIHYTKIYENVLLLYYYNNYTIIFTIIILL